MRNNSGLLLRRQNATQTNYQDTFDMDANIAEPIRFVDGDDTDENFGVKKEAMYKGKADEMDKVDSLDERDEFRKKAHR